ncbi:precorrin-8X methylmutase CbiC/CobH [Calothrix sp. NIES-4071]|nr:precorrin-8X methylmutase CbiC/CobH [Calothrix sp. NIES-4071]BAZ59004.1 precorrin-8X methylmutase CbiC/CobH [Calothrix sp. NIES-4105]
MRAQNLQNLTIKELTELVGGGLTPRMVRHYHKLGLLPEASRSQSNYRLYTDKDIQHLRRIVALKSQGFQLDHIRKLLQPLSKQAPLSNDLLDSLQQQYRSVTSQLTRLRQTASALEGLLGRDHSCLDVQAEALLQLRQLEVETSASVEQLEQLWDGLDAATDAHPEDFNESLQQLLPLPARSQIEVDLLSKLVIASGDVTLVDFVRWSQNAIASSRNALQSKCEIIVDVSAVCAGIDQARVAHLGATVNTLIDDPHITNFTEIELEYCSTRKWQDKLQQVTPGCILVVGYAPSVLMSICNLVEKKQIQPALIIGMPIGFSHAPAAKRRLSRSGVEYITTLGINGGGLLAVVALNALIESLIEKPHCHCYLRGQAN